MATNHLIAKAETTIDAPVDKVWDAFVNPEVIKQYMAGTTVVSDWTEGSKITWSGEWKGKPYEDKGEILAIVPQHKLQYTHFSPLSGVADVPDNYHTVTVDLSASDGGTKIALAQDNNETEEAKNHSAETWTMMLTSLKKILEERQ